MQRFDHEKLDVDQAAVEFVALADESAAILDVCRRLKLVSEASYAAGRDLLLRIVSMLVTMVRRDSGSATGTQGHGGGNSPWAQRFPSLGKTAPSRGRLCSWAYLTSSAIGISAREELPLKKLDSWSQARSSFHTSGEPIGEACRRRDDKTRSLSAGFPKRSHRVARGG